MLQGVDIVQKVQVAVKIFNPYIHGVGVKRYLVVQPADLIIFAQPLLQLSLGV